MVVDPPALYAVKVGLPFLFRMASAIIERAEFPVHKNKTLYCACICLTQSREHGLRDGRTQNKKNGGRPVSRIVRALLCFL
jgi:hypothetical protein